MAVEDKRANGYGFAVAHRNDLVVLGIERRTNGRATALKSQGYQIGDASLKDAWYYFNFYLAEGNEIIFSIDSPLGERLQPVKVHDSLYNIFERVVIHGGHPYYIDDLNTKSM